MSISLKDIYQIFVREGIKTDLRSKKQTKAALTQNGLKYNQLTRAQKKFFDKECLTNPYADTRILFGDESKKIKTVLVGIDIEVGEILLAHTLRQLGREIDLVIGHHPKGRAWACLDDVMHLQTDIMCNMGISQDVAKGLMNRRINEVSRRLHGSNHMQSIDAARLLNIPFMCCHTPADNHVAQFLQNLVNIQKPRTLSDVIRLLLKEPEYQAAAFNQSGPKILVGKPDDLAGHVFVDMTGGASGSKELFPRLSQIGIQTMLCMHMSEQHFTKVKSEYMHVVVAGHMASDNLGMNIILDKVLKKADIEIIECSGFRRFKR